MSKSNVIRNLLLIILLVALGIVGRIVPHMPNFAPIGAIALFGGTYLPKKLAIPMVLSAMLASDLIMGYRLDYLLSLTTFIVYGSFAAGTLIGLWIRAHQSVSNIAVGTIAGSLLFFLTTNAAVWLEPNSWYPKGLDGLLQSYYMGLPFLRFSLMGDLFYTTILFGGYALITNLSTKLAWVPKSK